MNFIKNFIERHMIPPRIIAIAGGSGSGKTTTALRLQRLLGEENCKILSQDSYYRDQSKNFMGDGSINYDHPDAIDFTLLEKHLSLLVQKLPVQVPLYDFVTHTRLPETILFEPTKYIIVDGILLLAEVRLRHYFYSSLFLDIPEDLRFYRRLKRDVEERGRQSEGVTVQFFSFVKPMHDQFVQPSRRYAAYVAHDEMSLNNALLKIKESLSSLV